MNDAQQTDIQAEEERALRRGLIAWFAGNHVAANILMFLFVIGGLISVSAMRTETFPSIDPRMITISVVYPGATPYEVADSVTSRIEDALVGLDGVKRISGSAMEGYGLITVKLEDFADEDDVYNDVETQVNALSNFPPANAERPIFKKATVTPEVMTLALYGNVPESTLKYWAETVDEELRQLDGVALTNVTGLRDYQIAIEVSEDTLRQYGLSLDDVRSRVAAFSTDIPAGSIEAKQGDILLRVQEKKFHGADFKKIALKTMDDGSILRLGDVATVIDGFADNNIDSRYNGEPAAFIQVSRNVSEDTLDIAKAVKSYVRTLKLPAGLHVALQHDGTINLLDRINLMMRNAILGFMLVFLVLLIFLDFKLAFWTSAAIPVCFLGGLMLIHFMGYSLNMISLFALIVVLGIVVDDAIVMGESIFEAQEEAQQDGTNPKDAVLRGVRAVIAPVTVGVSTTIAAFAPLYFSTGTLGQIISIVPIVVIAILFVSLIEACFILPAHLSGPGRWSKGIMRDIRRHVSKGLHFFIDHAVLPFARLCIRWRYATLAAFCGLAIITVGMFTSGTIRFIFFPAVEGDEIKITATLPEGTPYAITEATMKRIEAESMAVLDKLQQKKTEILRDRLKKEQSLAALNRLEKESGQKIYDNIIARIGETSTRGGPGTFAGGGAANNVGQINIQLVPSDFRSESSATIENMIRERIKDLPNIEKLTMQSSLVGEDPDIDVELTHSDENVLNSAAETLLKELKAIRGTKEVSNSYEAGKREYVFELTKQGLAVGLTPAMIGNQIRSSFFGSEVQRIQRGTDEIKVYVRYPKAARDNPASLEDMRIHLPDGRTVPLNSVAKIHQQQGYAKIETVNGRRVISVTSDVDYSITTPNDVMTEMNKNILPQLMERYPGLSYSYEGESRDQKEDLQSLGRNMMIALVLIYVLLGAQLRSYIQPFVIMTAIPFGYIGAIWGHYLLGHDITFISLFGAVALTGVVVNDSVVLMDYLNTHKEEQKSGIIEAGLAAVRRRFRPILLTTLTTCVGLLPILLETSMQAQFLIPMVISLCAGILFSTTVILLLIPCLITIIDDIKRLPSRLRHIIQR